MSALHIAAANGYIESIKFLIDEAQVKIDIPDNRGWPPLLYANFQAHEECVMCLLKPNPGQLHILGELLKDKLAKPLVVSIMR